MKYTDDVMRAVLAATLALAACGGNGTKNSGPWPDASPSTLDAPAPWWQPTPGSIGHWDIQLAPPFVTEIPVTDPIVGLRTMFVFRLWDLIPTTTTIDYADGSPVQVPAGALAGTLAELRARRPQPRIICEFGTGSIGLTEPDARKFPGFEASPPDDPTPPKAGSVIGWSTTLPATRRWLDVREAARAQVAPVLARRFELAAAIGCDGVLPDDNDMFRVVKADGTGAPGSGTGFAIPAPIDFPGEQGWYEAVAMAAHAQQLSVGMRGAYDVLTGALVASFDWQIADRCGEFGNCENTREFSQLHKAVLPLDYDHDLDGAPQNVGTTCGAQKANNISDGIVKNVGLTGASYFACTDFM